MKVIIAGSRSIKRYDLVKRIIENSPFEITTVISGHAQGVDKDGERWANENNIPLEIYEAEWTKYGRRAGVIRNLLMAEKADALIAIWDAESKGTAHMINAARQKGLLIYKKCFTTTYPKVRECRRI